MEKQTERNEAFAHIPPVVLNGLMTLWRELGDLHDELCAPETEHLAAQLAESISLLRALSDEVDEEFSKRTA